MPLAQSWLELEAATGGRVVMKGSLDEIYAMDAGLKQFISPQLPKPSDNVESKDGAVDGIKYRLYWPKNVTAVEHLPTAIWTHGGGLLLGDLDSDDLLCRDVSEHTHCAVVSIDYRLSPEYQWPTQLEDCMKVYRWAHKNHSSFHGDPDKFFTVGGSAGGALALQIANQVVQDPELQHTLKGIAAFVPYTLHPANVPDHLKATHTSHAEAVGTPVLDTESLHVFFDYVGLDPNDTDTFIALGERNHAKFPPTYVACCEYDPCRDDANVLETALRRVGVPTKLDYYPGFPHYFHMFPSIPEGRQFVDNLLDGVKWLQSQM